MKGLHFLLIVLFLPLGGAAYGQGTVPTLRYSTGQGSVALPGRDPAQGGTTLVPTVLVPVRLEFDSPSGRRLEIDPAADVARVLGSPVFSKADFGADRTQYVDAMLRATAGEPAGWHTLLGRPDVRPVTVKIPPGYGYVLTSRRTRTRLVMLDAEYVQREVFRQIPRQQGKLVIALASNAEYYSYGDATVCCSWLHARRRRGDAVRKNASLEILDELVHPDADLAAVGLRDGQGIDVAIEFSPLPSPIGANLFLSDNFAALGSLGPTHVFRHEG